MIYIHGKSKSKSVRTTNDFCTRVGVTFGLLRNIDVMFIDIEIFVCR